MNFAVFLFDYSSYEVQLRAEKPPQPNHFNLLLSAKKKYSCKKAINTYLSQVADCSSLVCVWASHTECLISQTSINIYIYIQRLLWEADVYFVPNMKQTFNRVFIEEQEIDKVEATWKYKSKRCFWCYLKRQF